MSRIFGPILKCGLPFFLLLLAFGACVAPMDLNGAPGRSQTNPSAALDSLVSTISQKITENHLENVVVIGAAGPKPDAPTEFGRQLGSEFTAALAKQSSGFRVVDRDALRDLVTKNGVSQVMVVSDALADWIALKANAEGFVVLQIGNALNGAAEVNALLYCPAPDEGTLLFTAKAELELNSAGQEGLRPVNSDWNKITRGFREPTCASCPNPSLTNAARNFARSSSTGTGIFDTVTLAVTVLPDGTTGDVAVVKSARFGLNANAVDIVTQKWRFKPGADADGKPTPVRLILQVTYRTF
jgi:hypothetical protein